jgi:hypothetical protein
MEQSIRDREAVNKTSDHEVRHRDVIVGKSTASSRARRSRRRAPFPNNEYGEDDDDDEDDYDDVEACAAGGGSRRVLDVVDVDGKEELNEMNRPCVSPSAAMGAQRYRQQEHQHRVARR